MSSVPEIISNVNVTPFTDSLSSYDPAASLYQKYIFNCLQLYLFLFFCNPSYIQ